MPVVEPISNQRVLVTGANGYIAMWIIHTLLSQGYTVRGTVRSEEKGKHLRQYFGSYGEKLELVVVEDIAKDGAFDDAVKGVDAIEHTATPLTSSTGDPDDYIKPAVHGTVGILKSALEFGKKVKRIVVTSSCAAVIDLEIKPTVIFDEGDWGDECVRIVKEEGKDASPSLKYRASKTLAEQAAWEFYKQNQAKISWDLITLIPSVVIGPTLQQVKNPEDLGASLALWWANISKEKSDDVLKSSYPYVDVRDIAAAHVTALRKEKAGGERIIISNVAMTWQEMRNRIFLLQPTLYTTGILQRGKPEMDTIIQYDVNSEKGKKIMEFQYKSMDETINDTLTDFEARGWLQKPQEG